MSGASSTPPRPIQGRPVVAGSASGPLLTLRAPISFWGGIDPGTGRVSDPRHPDHGRSVAGAVLLVPRTVGSSSSSAIMLELLRVGCAPAALLLGEVDAILALGVIVSREMGHGSIPVVEVDALALAGLGDGTRLSVHADGSVVREPS